MLADIKRRTPSMLAWAAMKPPAMPRTVFPSPPIVPPSPCALALAVFAVGVNWSRPWTMMSTTFAMSVALHHLAVIQQPFPHQIVLTMPGCLDRGSAFWSTGYLFLQVDVFRLCDDLVFRCALELPRGTAIVAGDLPERPFGVDSPIVVVNFVSWEYQPFSLSLGAFDEPLPKGAGS